ncbi:MAG: hypothetical protein KDM91_12380 [Verrucomicrobiae bacterium]|nr:hypothetical protein [Verrucomicrobiae bacterium]
MIKRLSAALACTALAFALGACEGHSFDETKQLHLEHGHGHGPETAHKGTDAAHNAEGAKEGSHAAQPHSAPDAKPKPAEGESRNLGL